MAFVPNTIKIKAKIQTETVKDKVTTMALVRWNPWREIATLQQQMNHLFDDALVPEKARERSFVRVPAAEMEETQEAIHLKLEVPGIEAKDLDK